MLVAGEAGIGKSALVRRFSERHSGDARFLLGVCDPLLTPRALGPLHDIARQTGGRLATLLAAGSPREQLFAALLDELDQPARAQVVVMEDAHWADEATLDLLVFLGRRMEQSRALLIVTYRDDELGVDHPLRTVIGRLPPAAARRLLLEPLSEAAVAELARRAGRPTAGLRELTGGNPLLVTEVLAAADAGVPLTVRDLVLARFGGLPADAQQVVRLVAVVPTRAELWLLEQSLGPPSAPAVEVGVAAGLLVVGEEAVGFRHELLRQAVEDSLSTLARRELNRRVLEVLAASTERQVDIARLAHHAREAGDTGAVLRYAPEAAKQAAAVAAHREAAGHYRAAIAHADRLPPPERADLLEGYSFQAYLAGLGKEALDARLAALQIREAEGSREQLGECLRWLSRLFWWAGRRREAEAAGARAIAVLETEPPGHQLAMAYSNQAQLDMLAYRSEAAMNWAGRAIELAQRLGDKETLTHALTNIGTARWTCGDQGGRDELERAFEVATAAGLEDHAARALVNLASGSVELRDYQHARGDLDRALAFTVQHDLVGYTQALTGVRASLRLDQGDWAGAEQDARAARAEWEPWRQGSDHSGGRAGGLGPAAGTPRRPRRHRHAGGGLRRGACPREDCSGSDRWPRPRRARLAARGADRIAEEAASAFELAVQVRHPWYRRGAGLLAVAGRCAAGGSGGRRRTVPVAAGRRLAGGRHAWRALGCAYERAQALAHGDGEAGRQALRLLDGLGASQAAHHLRRQLRARGIRSRTKR